MLTIAFWMMVTLAVGGIAVASDTSVMKKTGK